MSGYGPGRESAPGRGLDDQGCVQFVPDAL
jgi:hypothetical protein